MRGVIALLAATSALGLTAISKPVGAQELRTWPAPHETLWGGWQASCNFAQASKSVRVDAGAKIAPELCSHIKKLEKPLVQNFGQQLRDKLKAKVTLSEGLPPGVRVSDTLKDTLIASLHLSRADIWLVPKRNTQEIVIPYTITLNLTNAASGEVAYTVSKSVALQGLFPLGAEGISEASAQLGDSLSGAVTALVDEAAAHFKPYAIAATVKEKLGEGNFILDKGRLDGLRRGDRIGFSGQVLFSDANYSVFSDSFSKIEVGQQVTKSATAPIDVLSRPTVFAVIAQSPPGMSADYLKIQFEQQLGQGKALTVMPSNRSFSNIRELMLEEATKSDALTSRPTPDYLLRVRVYALPSTHFDTNLPGTKVYSYEAHALAELTDSSGRIVYATSVKNHIDDQVTAEISFSDDARQDTVVKNALIQLADKISLEFKPQAFRLAISRSGGSAVISDPSGSISQGATGVVLHKRGKISGISGDVWVPLGEYQLIPTAEGRLGLAGDGFNKNKPGNGDVFAFDSGSTNNLSSISYSGCSDNVALVDISASSRPEVLFALAENRFAANFAAPVYIHGFGNLLSGLMEEDFDKDLLKKMGALSRGDTERCFRPVVRITRGDDAATRAGGVAPTVKVISGFTLHAGTTSASEKLLGGGRQNELTGSEVPLHAQPNEKEVSLVRDLANLVPDQTTQWLKSTQPPK